jgi:hypothetical protein
VTGDLGPFARTSGLRFENEIPRLLRVVQSFDTPPPISLQTALRDQLSGISSRLRPGNRVAVTVGSRGIGDLVEILGHIGDLLRQFGADPFIVPAMGSHGGGTAAGQRAVLEHLGVSEPNVRMKVTCSDQTDDIGEIADGPRVVVDHEAMAADFILAVNRIKPHTDFHGPVESGLAKILAIGLGKQAGAGAIHAAGPVGLARYIPQAARMIVGTGKVLGGLAILENALHQTTRLAFVEPDQIGGPAESRLLDEARSLVATLPFSELEVLVVSELGKDRSGAGIDPNVIGRMRIEGTAEPLTPAIAIIVVLGLTPQSDGNGIGLGLADLTTLRAVEALDLRATYLNSLTAGLGGVRRGAIPVALPTDRDAVAAALAICGEPVADRRRLVFIRDTLSLDELVVSESLMNEVNEHPRLTVSGPVGQAFDGHGNFCGWEPALRDLA